MTLSDWRDATAEAVQPLLLAERRRVLEALHWDLGPAFKAVELARQRGDVPGLLLTDQHGRHAGWAFYLLANRQLQIGGLQATSAGGLRVLLDGILSSTEATLAAGISCFLEASTRSLPSALTRLRFDLQRHEYLEATLSEPWTRPPVTAVRRFDRADIPSSSGCWPRRTRGSRWRGSSRRTPGSRSGRNMPRSCWAGRRWERGSRTSRVSCPTPAAGLSRRSSPPKWRGASRTSRRWWSTRSTADRASAVR
jgi:hypothetical protein